MRCSTKMNKTQLKELMGKGAHTLEQTGGRKLTAYQEFVKKQRKAGKSMKEAAAAWKSRGSGAHDDGENE